SNELVKDGGRRAPAKYAAFVAVMLPKFVRYFRRGRLGDQKRSPERRLISPAGVGAFGALVVSVSRSVSGRLKVRSTLRASAINKLVLCRITSCSCEGICGARRLSMIVTL